MNRFINLQKKMKIMMLKIKDLIRMDLDSKALGPFFS